MSFGMYGILRVKIGGGEPNLINEANLKAAL